MSERSNCLVGPVVWVRNFSDRIRVSPLKMRPHLFFGNPPGILFALLKQGLAEATRNFQEMLPHLYLLVSLVLDPLLMVGIFHLWSSMRTILQFFRDSELFPQSLQIPLLSSQFPFRTCLRFARFRAAPSPSFLKLSWRSSYRMQLLKKQRLCSALPFRTQSRTFERTPSNACLPASPPSTVSYSSLSRLLGVLFAVSLGGLWYCGVFGAREQPANPLNPSSTGKPLHHYPSSSHL